MTYHLVKVSAFDPKSEHVLQSSLDLQKMMDQGMQLLGTVEAQGFDVIVRNDSGEVFLDGRKCARYPDGTPLFPGDSLDDNPQGGWPEELDLVETLQDVFSTPRPFGEVALSPESQPHPLPTFPAKPEHPNAELLELVTNPATPKWLVELIPVLLDKDPVDVANTFSYMGQVLERRLNAFLASAQVKILTTCDGCHELCEGVETVLVAIPGGKRKARYCPRCRDDLVDRILDGNPS